MKGLSDILFDAVLVWANNFNNRLEQAAVARQLRGSGRLTGSVHTVAQSTPTEMRVETSFLEYGRVLDMKKRDSAPNRLDRLGHLVPKKDRNRRWYNVTVGKEVRNLRYALLAELDKLVAESFINNFED